MKKLFIKNRKGMRMVVVIEEIKDQKGLVFLMHGISGFKEHPLLEETAKIFNKSGFTAVKFDTTNSIGESDGKMEDGTIAGYYEDLEDITEWSKTQKWYQEPFSLVGHSWGGYCIANYATNNQNKIKNLILFSSVVSGKLYQENDDIRPVLKEWKEKGIRIWESSSSPGVIKRLKYTFIEDGLNYDLLKIVDKIKCPVLMIAGNKDRTVHMEYQKMLFDKINSQKQFYIIKDGDHNLKGKENSQELFDVINNWIVFNLKQ